MDSKLKLERRLPARGVELKNIQHPTSNIEHPNCLPAKSMVVGCSMLDVGCSPGTRRVGNRRSAPLTSEFLILPDGRVLVHNLTQPMAELLRKLNPGNRQITERVRSLFTQHATRNTHHELPD